MRLGAWSKGRIAGFAILFVLLAAYFVLPRIIGLTATEVRGDVGLWLYANDLAPGDRFDARVWVDDSVSKETIRYVVISSAGRSHQVRGENDNDLELELQVPERAADRFDLTIEVFFCSRGEVPS